LNAEANSGDKNEQIYDLTLVVQTETIVSY